MSFVMVLHIIELYGNLAAAAFEVQVGVVFKEEVLEIHLGIDLQLLFEAQQSIRHFLLVFAALFDVKFFWECVNSFLVSLEICIEMLGKFANVLTFESAGLTFGLRSALQAKLFVRLFVIHLLSWRFINLLALILLLFKAEEFPKFIASDFVQVDHLFLISAAAYAHLEILKRLLRIFQRFSRPHEVQIVQFSLKPTRFVVL